MNRKLLSMITVITLTLGHTPQAVAILPGAALYLMLTTQHYAMQTASFIRKVKADWDDMSAANKLFQQDSSDENIRRRQRDELHRQRTRGRNISTVLDENQRTEQERKEATEAHLQHITAPNRQPASARGGAYYLALSHYFFHAFGEESTQEGDQDLNE